MSGIELQVNVITFSFLSRKYKVIFAFSVQEQSHKSYRPLCILTFRWNYSLHQLEPMGYHLVNMMLHSIVCLMYFR